MDIINIEEPYGIIWLWTINNGDDGINCTRFLPGDDVSNESQEIRDIAEELWTDEVVQQWQDYLKPMLIDGN